MSYRFSAMLHVPGDVRDAIAFYGVAFGAAIGWSTPSSADMVAQLLVHGVEFWVHPADEATGNASPAQLGGTAVRLMLIVEDPDAVFDQAVAAGAVVRSPMQEHDYGWRDGSLMVRSVIVGRSVGRFSSRRGDPRVQNPRYGRLPSRTCRKPGRSQELPDIVNTTAFKEIYSQLGRQSTLNA